MDIITGYAYALLEHVYFIADLKDVRAQFLLKKATTSYPTGFDLTTRKSLVADGGDTTDRAARANVKNFALIP
jgi:hypothetical protein